MRNEHAESDILRSPRQQFTRMRHWAKSLLSTIGLLSVLECKSLWHLRKQWTEVNCQYNGCLHVGFWVWFSSRSGWDGHCVAPWWGFQISLSKQIAKKPKWHRFIAGTEAMNCLCRTVKQQCPVTFTVSARKESAQYLEISKVTGRHNHPVAADTYATCPSVRRLTAAKQQEHEQLVSVLVVVRYRFFNGRSIFSVCWLARRQATLRKHTCSYKHKFHRSRLTIWFNFLTVI